MRKETGKRGREPGLGVTCSDSGGGRRANIHQGFQELAADGLEIGPQELLAPMHPVPATTAVDGPVWGKSGPRMHKSRLHINLTQSAI